MKKSAAFIFLLGLFALLRQFEITTSAINSEPIILTGTILITAYLLALSLKKIKFPKLTGYMILGMIVGPMALNYLNHETLGELKFLENMALSFIAITAGGELKYTRIKKHIKTVVSLIAGQVVFVFLGLFLLLVFFAPYIPFFSQLDYDIMIGFAILFSGTAVSKSPATTMGIITELKSKGTITEIVLAVTVLKSILLVLVFPALIMWSKLYLIKDAVFNMNMLSRVMTEIGSSIILGVILGFFIIWYLKSIKTNLSIFLLGVVIIITEASSLYGVEILLTSIITGIIVENFSDAGELLIKNIEKSSLPFYIIFFSFAGASLHLDTLKKALGLTLFLVLARMALLYLGNLTGAVFVKANDFLKHKSWLGFVGQAGIAVGLGTIIENTFPGRVGLDFKTILLATVVINELIGPIFLKYILIKSNEAQIKS